MENSIKKVTDYEIIQDLVKDVSNVVYNKFDTMTWTVVVDTDTFHKPLEQISYKRYIIKYNIRELSMLLRDDYGDIYQLATKTLEQFRLRQLIKILIEKLKDAGFVVHRYEDDYRGVTCGYTHIIEIWRENDERQNKNTR